MRIIKIQYKNGAVWGFSVKVLADLRAKHYAKSDPDTTYQEEYDYTYRSFNECYDWLRNNVSYELLGKHLFEIKPPAYFDPISAMDEDDTEFGMLEHTK